MPSRRPWAQISIPSTLSRSSARGDHDGARQRDVGAVLLEARQPGAIARRERRHVLHQLLEPLPREQVAVDLAERVLGAALVHRRERPDRPADPDHPPARALEPGHVVELPDDVLAERLEVGTRRPLAGQEALGHADGAQRAREGAPELAAIDLRDLDAPAPEVEDVAVAERRAVDRAEVAVPGLLLGRERPDGEGAVGREGLEHLVGVCRVAHRAGGDRRHVVDAGGLAEGGVEPHGVGGPLDGLGGEALRARPGGEPHDRSDLVHQLERPARPVAEDHQPEGVGAHVDDRQAALGARGRR